MDVIVISALQSFDAEFLTCVVASEGASFSSAPEANNKKSNIATYSPWSRTLFLFLIVHCTC